MSHQSQLDLVKVVAQKFEPCFHDCSVLEIGSLDINGSVRSFFQNCRYVGLDVASGPGVDVVCQGQDYDAPDNSFDTVVSCEVMEHNPHWQATFLNMIRVCKPGGFILMTCATVGRPEHGTARTSPASSPLTVGLGWDLSGQDFQQVLDLPASFSHHSFFVNWSSYDLYFVGIKHADAPPLASRWDSLTEAIQRFVNQQNQRGTCRYRPLLARCLGEYGFRGARWIEAKLIPRKQKSKLKRSIG